MSIESLKARYAELCDQRDAKNAEIKPLQEQLDALNAEIAEKQAAALAIAIEISTARGGQKWLDLKKEIGVLANALSGKLK